MKRNDDLFTPTLIVKPCSFNFLYYVTGNIFFIHIGATMDEGYYIVSSIFPLIPENSIQNLTNSQIFKLKYIKKPYSLIVSY